MSFDFSATYTVEGYEGIAWRAVGHPMAIEECQGHPDDLDGPMGETFYCDGSCEEPYENTDRVLAIMIGDDRRFDFDVDELHAIREEDYCAGCGQIGCGHDGREH